LSQKTRDERKISGKLSEVSEIFELLKSFMNILRDHTEEAHLKKVQEYLRDCSMSSFSMRISY